MTHHSDLRRVLPGLLILAVVCCAGASEAAWYKGEMHCHLANSVHPEPNSDDGAFASVADAVTAYREAGYDFLAITGHNIRHDSDAFSVEGRFVTLLGVELHDYGGTWMVDNPGWGHVNSIGCSAAGLVDTSQCRTMQDQIDLAISLGGIAQINHPGWAGADGAGGAGIVTTERLLETTKATLLEMKSPLWQAMWDAYLSTGRQIFGTITTDNHTASATTTRMVVVEAAELTRPAIMKALREGRFYSQTGQSPKDPVLINSITCTGRTLTVDSIGDSVTFIGRDGAVLAFFEQGVASYTLPEDGLYVRARVALGTDKAAYTQAYFPAATPEAQAAAPAAE